MDLHVEAVGLERDRLAGLGGVLDHLLGDLLGEGPAVGRVDKLEEVGEGALAREAGLERVVERGAGGGAGHAAGGGDGGGHRFLVLGFGH